MLKTSARALQLLSLLQVRREWSGSWVGVLAPFDADHCVLTMGGDTHETIAALVVHAGVDFTLLEPPELAQPIRDIATRLLQGVG